MSVLLWSGDICACVFVFLFKTIVNALAYLDRQTDRHTRAYAHTRILHFKKKPVKGGGK